MPSTEYQIRERDGLWVVTALEPIAARMIAIFFREGDAETFVVALTRCRECNGEGFITEGGTLKQCQRCAGSGESES